MRLNSKKRQEQMGRYAVAVAVPVTEDSWKQTWEELTPVYTGHMTRRLLGDHVRVVRQKVAPLDVEPDPVFLGSILLAKITPIQRQILQGIFVEGKEYSEVAEDIAPLIDERFTVADVQLGASLALEQVYAV